MNSNNNPNDNNPNSTNTYNNSENRNGSDLEEPRRFVSARPGSNSGPPPPLIIAPKGSGRAGGPPLLLIPPAAARFLPKGGAGTIASAAAAQYQVQPNKPDRNTLTAKMLGVPPIVTNANVAAAKKAAASVYMNTSTSSNEGCTCKRSMCLKLYCQCFSAKYLCSPQSCRCLDCRNNDSVPEYAQLRKDAIQNILLRNPSAFGGLITSKKAAHEKVGCKCRKSFCLKKYCECFNKGLRCNDFCQCMNCRNVDGADITSGSLLSAAPPLMNRPAPTVDDVAAAASNKSKRRMIEFNEVIEKNGGPEYFIAPASKKARSHKSQLARMVSMENPNRPSPSSIAAAHLSGMKSNNGSDDDGVSNALLMAAMAMTQLQGKNSADPDDDDDNNNTVSSPVPTNNNIERPESSLSTVMRCNEELEEIPKPGKQQQNNHVKVKVEDDVSPTSTFHKPPPNLKPVTLSTTSITAQLSNNHNIDNSRASLESAIQTKTVPANLSLVSEEDADSSPAQSQESSATVVAVSVVNNNAEVDV